MIIILCRGRRESFVENSCWDKKMDKMFVATIYKYFKGLIIITFFPNNSAKHSKCNNCKMKGVHFLVVHKINLSYLFKNFFENKH